MDVTPDAPPEETWDDIPEDILNLSPEEINTRTRLIDNDIKVRLTRALRRCSLTAVCSGYEVRNA